MFLSFLGSVWTLMMNIRNIFINIHCLLLIIVGFLKKKIQTTLVHEANKIRMSTDIFILFWYLCLCVCLSHLVNMGGTLCICSSHYFKDTTIKNVHIFFILCFSHILWLFGWKGDQQGFCWFHPLPGELSGFVLNFIYTTALPQCRLSFVFTTPNHSRVFTLGGGA